jgi:hypothetical protein
MTVVVENGRDQIEAYTTGKGVFPVPPEVKADNDAQAAKSDPEKKVEAKDNPAIPPKVETPPDDAGDDEEGEDGLTPRQKREFTKAMQATIGKKHRMQKEAEEFAAEQYNNAKLADARAAKLEADLAALREQLKPAKVEETKKPARADFKAGEEGDQAYWDALVDYRADLKIAALKADQAKADQERFIQEETQHAQAKMDRAFEQGPDDFKEVYESADMVLPNYVLEAIKSSDLMPELVYFLGTNPDRAERIKAMTDGCPVGSARYARAAQRQLVEIGKIESTLSPFSKEKVKPEDAPEASQKTAKAEPEDAPEASQKTAKAEPETESAPSKPRVNAPIIKPLNGGSASQVEKDEADLTGSQVLTKWQKKHGVVLTARKRH